MTDTSPHAPHSAKKSQKALEAKRTQPRKQQQAAAQMQRLKHPRRRAG